MYIYKYFRNISQIYTIVKGIFLWSRAGVNKDWCIVKLKRVLCQNHVILYPLCKFTLPFRTSKLS